MSALTFSGSKRSAALAPTVTGMSFVRARGRRERSVNGMVECIVVIERVFVNT